MDAGLRQTIRERLAALRGTGSGSGVKGQGGLGLQGHLTVRREDGSVMFDGRNKIVNAGMQHLVDMLQAAGNINSYKYVAFGTGNADTQATDTALGTEVSGGTYARLEATQGEGDNAREYRLTGTWTNNSGASRIVTEYGIFGAATTGTMLARICDSEDAQSLTKTVATSETIAVTWDIQLADA